MKRSLLLFGANSFVAKSFIANYGDAYDIHPVYRSGKGHPLEIDFTDTNSVDALVRKIDFPLHGIIFLQGINPSNGFKDITAACVYRNV